MPGTLIIAPVQMPGAILTVLVSMIHYLSTFMLALMTDTASVTCYIGLLSLFVAIRVKKTNRYFSFDYFAVKNFPCKFVLFFDNSMRDECL